MKTLNLRIYRDGELVEQKTLAQDVIKIGKLRSSHLCLDHDAVARMHAVIEVSGNDVRVIDLGSSSGTVLNGGRVDKNAVLSHGDTLQFGPFTVEVEIGAGAGAAAPAFQQQAPAFQQQQAPAFQQQHAPAFQASAAAGHAPVHIEVGEVEVHDGTRVAEVVAMYGKTVLDVQHVGQVKDKRAQAPLWLAVGGLLILAGGGAVANEVAQDWDGYKQQVKEAAETGRPAPPQPGWGIAGLGISLALLGLIPFMFGASRLQDAHERSYTIGEGHDASFHVPTYGIPDSVAFPLVSGGDHDFVLNFTREMSGDVTLDGTKLTVGELVSSGRAGSSGSYYSFPLPHGAHCRIKYGDVTFHVNSVPPGAVIAQKSETDKPFWLYNSASLAVVGTILILSHLIADEALEMNLDDLSAENRFVGYMNQPDELKEEEPPPEQENSDDEAGGTGQRHKGEEGKMGKPTSKNKSGLYAMKGPKDAIPQMARNFDPDMMARNAGILGVMQQQSGHFLASPYGGAFAVGNDDEDVWGGLTGTEIGEAYGVGGLGLVGTGRGGGGTGEGTIGLGNVGLIGKGGGGGTGSGYGRGSGAGFGGRGARVPTVRQAKAAVQGAMDKDIIRRIVRSHINEVRHCYNQGLVRDPNLKGRVSVNFTIGPTGAVPVAVVQESTIKDNNVAQCVAKAVKRWKFPRPQGGGNVIVTYPFVLEPG